MYGLISAFANSIPKMQVPRGPYRIYSLSDARVAADNRVRAEYGGDRLKTLLMSGITGVHATSKEVVRKRYGEEKALDYAFRASLDLDEFEFFFRHYAPMSVPVTRTDLSPIFRHFLPTVEEKKIWDFIQAQQDEGVRTVIAGSAITSTLDELATNGGDLDLFIQTASDPKSAPGTYVLGPRRAAIDAYIAFFRAAGYRVTAVSKGYGTREATGKTHEYDFENNIQDVITLRNFRTGQKIDLVFSETPFEMIIQHTDFMHCILYVAFTPSVEGIQPLCVVADPWAVRDRLLIQNGMMILPRGNSAEIRAMAEKRLTRLDKYVARGWSAELIPEYRDLLIARLGA